MFSAHMHFSISNEPNNGSIFFFVFTILLYCWNDLELFLGWCLSNKEDEEFMKIFFTYLKKSCGRLVPKWFMADIAPQSYNAFCSVMQCNPKRLYCTWHVLKAWRNAIRENIPGKPEDVSDTHADIYNRLLDYHC